MLPNDLCAWIGRAYRRGFKTGRHPLPSYLDAHPAALEWMREHAVEKQG
jgi:hypothetical protein